MIALKNAKLSRSATLAGKAGTPHNDISHLPSTYIAFLQHGNISLEMAEEAGEKDHREGASAVQHASAESQTSMHQSASDKILGDSLNDPSSLVYRLCHR